MLRAPICAFTRLEAVVVVTVAAVLLALSLPYLSTVKVRGAKVECSNKLRIVGVHFESWAAEEGQGRFPMSVSTNRGGTAELLTIPNSAYRHFQVLSNVLRSPTWLVCPQDTRDPVERWEQLSNSRISYFVGLEAIPRNAATILAGDRNVTLQTGQTVRLVSEDARWQERIGLHGRVGNLLFGDSHSEHCEDAALRQYLEPRDGGSNLFAIP